MNPVEYDMVVLHFIGITIGDGDDNVPQGITEQQEQQIFNLQEGGELWKPEVIIFPCKADNIQNYFACFHNFTKEEVLNMIKIDIFLVFFCF